MNIFYIVEQWSLSLTESLKHYNIIKSLQHQLKSDGSDCSAQAIHDYLFLNDILDA